MFVVCHARQKHVCCTFGEQMIANDFFFLGLSMWPASNLPHILGAPGLVLIPSMK